MKVINVFVFVIVIFELIALILADGADSAVVKTKSGSIRGKLVQLAAARQDVYEFIGIPFAEPPVGERRFKKPVPKTPWLSVFNATKPPNECIQVRLPSAISDPSSNNSNNSILQGGSVPGTKESEDCLYLNIWTPRATLDALVNGNGTKQLAVYVFIHGGGFIGGNTMQYLFNGTIITGVNNIVFVSIQYRLGSLGFAYFGKNDDAPGNAGLWDQLEALKWISENIGAFGGNNSEVTIGGESAGAASVTYHLLSPYSRKYFQRAVVESGSALSSWAIHFPDVAMTVTDIVFHRTASDGECRTRSTIADKVRCLRSVDAMILSKADQIPISMGFGFGSVPVIDGDFVPKDPRQMLKEGNFYKIPMLMGANREEGSLFLLISPEVVAMLPTAADEETSLDNLSYLQYKKLMEIGFYITSGTPMSIGIDSTLLSAIELNYWPSSSQSGFPGGHDVIDAVVQAVGDYAFTCPTYYWADTLASPSPQEVNKENSVFVYHFSQRSAGTVWPEWMGVVHGDEMAYVFGEPFAAYAQSFGYSYDDKLLSKTMMEYWGNFIKYGDPNIRDKYSSCDNKSSPIGPNSCKLRNWPPYISEANGCPSQIVELNVMTQVFNYGEAVNCGLKARDCLFWTELFPKLTQLVASKGNRPSN